MSAVTTPIPARPARAPVAQLSQAGFGHSASVACEGDQVGMPARALNQTLTILCSDPIEGGDAPLATSLRGLGYRIFSGPAAFEAAARGEAPSSAIIVVALDMAGAERCLSQVAALDPGSSVRVLLCAPVEVVRHLAWARFHDFLAVPFAVTELAERVRRLTQRSAGVALPQRNDVLDVDGMMIDLAGRDVFLGGRSVRLTRLEFDLLAFFVAHPRRVLRRSELLAAVWGIADSFSRTVDIHLRRLRVKIGDDGQLIQTVRGVGYKLVAEVKPVSAATAT